MHVHDVKGLAREVDLKVVDLLLANQVNSICYACHTQGAYLSDERPSCQCVCALSERFNEPACKRETLGKPEMADKDCFGELNQVFPMGREGLREVTSSCFGCSELKACLESALSTRQGLTLRLEALDRGGQAAGIVGRVKHWSERKELVRRMKAKEGK